MGHAFIVEYKRTAKDQFGFSIFNSGEGIEKYHERLVFGHKELYLPFVEIKNLKMNKLLSPLLISSLKEILQGGELKSNEKHLYNNIVAILGGQVATRSLTVQDFLDPQQSGTCSYTDFLIIQHQEQEIRSNKSL